MFRNHLALLVGRLALITLIMLTILTFAMTAHANPKNIPAGAKKVYSFNVIGYPAGRTYNGGCGEGNRIFVNREANNTQIRVTNSSSGWNVLDCDATSDRTATLATYQPGLYDVYVRILGKPGGTLSICADTFEDFLAGETLCLLGTIDLTRSSGQSKFQLAPAAMFDATLEDLMWTAQTNGDFRIAQFRVYQRP
jgi:hypothetical protein